MLAVQSSLERQPVNSTTIHHAFKQMHKCFGLPDEDTDPAGCKDTLCNVGPVVLSGHHPVGMLKAHMMKLVMEHFQDKRRSFRVSSDAAAQSVDIIFIDMLAFLSTRCCHQCTRSCLLNITKKLRHGPLKSLFSSCRTTNPERGYQLLVHVRNFLYFNSEYKSTFVSAPSATKHSKCSRLSQIPLVLASSFSCDTSLVELSRISWPRCSK